MKRNWFVPRFALFLVIGFAAILPPVVQTRVLTPFTEQLAAVSAAILERGGNDVTREETLIFSPQFAVDVKNGCNGVEASLILVAAILAAPATWRERLIGIVAGLIVLQAVNLVRISSLYLIGLHYRRVFDLFHSAFWQVLIILVSLGIFIGWSVTIAKARNREAAA